MRDNDHNPVHCKETVTNTETFPHGNNLVGQDHHLKIQCHLKFQCHHHVEILFCQGYRSRLHQSIIFMMITQNISTYNMMTNLCNLIFERNCQGKKTWPIE